MLSEYTVLTKRNLNEYVCLFMAIFVTFYKYTLIINLLQKFRTIHFPV
jgi:hypothetical protein